MIDPVSSSGSSITQQTKKRPLEDDTATTGAYLQLVLHTRFFYPWFISFSLCFVRFEHWPRETISNPTSNMMRDTAGEREGREQFRNWSNHKEAERCLLWCLLIWLLCFHSNMLLVVWSVWCIWQFFSYLLEHPFLSCLFNNNKNRRLFSEWKKNQQHPNLLTKQRKNK